VNIMKARPKALLLLFLGVLAAGFGACGKKSDSGTTGQDTTTVSNVQGEPSGEEVIAEMLNDVITRLHYGDKSGLYENEFEYFTDEYNFDDYLKMDQTRYAQADTITFVEVRNVEFFDKDSALVAVTVHFEGPTGKKSYFRDKIVVYYHKGRWIKPTVSVIDQQLIYEDKIKVADSAAAAEAAENR